MIKVDDKKKSVLLCGTPADLANECGQVIHALILNASQNSQKDGRWMLKLILTNAAMACIAVETKLGVDLDIKSLNPAAAAPKSEEEPEKSEEKEVKEGPDDDMMEVLARAVEVLPPEEVMRLVKAIFGVDDDDDDDDEEEDG